MAVDKLLSRLKPLDTSDESPAKISTHLIVRQTTGLPRNTVQDLPQIPTNNTRKR
jgi:hypothetical protein